MITEKNVSKTIYFSLFMQIVTSLISADGIFDKLSGNDIILQDILKLELFVQAIEAIFYIWVIYALKDINLMTPRRYIDRMITTPTMLVSTLIFMKYQDYKENNKGTFTFWDFIKDDWENIKKLVIYNGLMLLFGYLGETNLLPKYLSISIGFVFFYLSFSIVYEYSKTTDVSKKLFYFLTIVWGMYGVSATFDVVTKNISYNLLDIVSKNFYGLFIYYKVKELSLGRNI